MRRCFLLLTTLLLAACVREPSPPGEALDLGHDYFSFANTGEFVTRHVSLDLAVDFDAKALRGSAVLSMQRLAPEATRVVLDTRDLHVERVSVAAEGGDPAPAAFEYTQTHEILGQALQITLPDGLGDAPMLEVTIAYETDPGATALQWLPAGLTAGGSHPFMFSQSQAIHARSWIPLQDTPSVRITYDATIRTSPELLAVMSADNDPLTPRNGEYRFSMPQPIPSYLMAIAAGNLYFAPIGEDTGIYAEPELLYASVFEFASTQKMLDTAEAIYGPYQWGRYDLLILPPSFPFGGMENPRLSFITPSVLAGDQSLVSLIAHELAHSWSGNLVTNLTWRDVWLNEGITSYLDSRLMEVLFGPEAADEERVLSYRELLAGIERIAPARQALAPTEDVDDPRASQGGLQYQKGQLFLQHLENLFGREAFDAFLASYFEHFAFQSISSEQFLDYLDENLLRAHPGTYDRARASEWLYAPGLPADAPVPVSASLDRAEATAKAWADGEVAAPDIPLDTWSPHAAVHFINSLPTDVSSERLRELDEAFGFSQTRNAEIGQAWFTQVATRRYLPAYDAMRDHLVHYGRIKLIFPVYMGLAGNGEDTALALEIFDSASANYHPITRGAIGGALERATGQAESQ